MTAKPTKPVIVTFLPQTSGDVVKKGRWRLSKCNPPGKAKGSFFSYVSLTSLSKREGERTVFGQVNVRSDLDELAAALGVDPEKVPIQPLQITEFLAKTLCPDGDPEEDLVLFWIVKPDGYVRPDTMFAVNWKTKEAVEAPLLFSVPKAPNPVE